MLTCIRLENFKSWKDTEEVTLAPITGFFGPNSSGKTSILQALLLMKQTVDSSDRGVVFHFGDDKTLVDLDNFESVIHEHDTERSLKFSIAWNSMREFVLPDAYSGGKVTEGDELRFEVAFREESDRSGKSVVVEEMIYRVAGMQFGMRRIPDPVGYELFAGGPVVNIARRSNKDERYMHRRNFHVFPHWADRLLRDDDLTFDLQLGLNLLLHDLHYLGPLRAHPNRIYTRSGTKRVNIGPDGANAVEAILASLEARETIITSGKPLLQPLDKYIAEWLKHLGLIHDFRVAPLAEGRRFFEVKVRKSPGSAEVLLTDVGFGVSQILPVLVQCFYVPRGSMIILEQPDIHLHPSVQAGIADIFIDAWKKRDVQVLFESHSEHLLRRLQRRIAEEEIDPEDVKLYFCSTEDNGNSRISPLEVDQFGTISNWPKDFFGDQFGEIAAMSNAALARQGDAE